MAQPDPAADQNTSLAGYEPATGLALEVLDGYRLVADANIRGKVEIRDEDVRVTYVDSQFVADALLIPGVPVRITHLDLSEGTGQFVEWSDSDDTPAPPWALWAVTGILSVYAHEIGTYPLSAMAVHRLSRSLGQSVAQP